MSTRKTILVHGLMAAIPLAIFGFLYAQMAGMWVASQTMTRAGSNGAIAASTVANASEITSAIAWRLPFTMAIFGFVFVACGESLKALWQHNEERKQNEGRVDLGETTTFETQRVSLDMVAQETIAMDLPKVYEDSDSLFMMEEACAVGTAGASNLHN